jgi:fucose permease
MSSTAPTFPMARMQRIAAAYYAAVAVEGLMFAALGPTLDALADQTGATTEAIAIVFTAMSSGYIGGSLLAGRLYGRLTGNSVLAAAVMAMAVFTAAVPLLGALWLLVVVFVVIGATIGLTDVGCNTLLVWLFRDRVPPYMNTMHLFFGIGAFLCPLIVDRFSAASGDAATTFWLYAGLMVPLAVWLAATPSPQPHEDRSAPNGMAIVRRHAVLLTLMALLFFMHAGAEIAFGGWIYSYAEELEIGGQTTSSVLNAVFWGGLVVGRLAAIPLSLRLTPRAMVQLNLIGAVAAVALIAVLRDWPPGLWIGTAGFGASIGPAFASCLNYTRERMPISGEVTAVLLVGGSLGSMSLPWLVGQFFDRRGPESLLWVVGSAIAVGLVLFAWIRAGTARDRVPA